MKSENLSIIAGSFSALSDPVRLKILMEILKEEKCVGKIAQALNLPLANVSHHLRLLEKAGMVRRKRYGKFIRYRAKSEELEKIYQFLKLVINQIRENRTD